MQIKSCICWFKDWLILEWLPRRVKLKVVWRSARNCAGSSWNIYIKKPAAVISHHWRPKLHCQYSMDQSGIYPNVQKPAGNPAKTKGWKKDCEHIYETEDFSQGLNTPGAALSGNVASHICMIGCWVWVCGNQCVFCEQCLLKSFTFIVSNYG